MDQQQSTSSAPFDLPTTPAADCSDLQIGNLHSALFLHICTSTSVALLLLLPASVLLCVLLHKVRRIHRNTRLLLAMIPIACSLDLLARFARLAMLQVLLHRDRQENCPPASLLLATDDSEQFSLVVLLLRWTVAGPAVVSYGLAMSMPLALVAEKCVATVCFKRYENGRRFSVVGFTILALQWLYALQKLRSVSPSHLLSSDNLAQPEDNSAEKLLFCYLVTLVLAVLLLAINNRISQQLCDQKPSWFCPSASASPCNLFRKGRSCAATSSSSSHLVTCRYQLRDNRRSLRFCVFLAALMALPPLGELLIRFRNTTSTTASNLEVAQQQQQLPNGGGTLIPLLLLLFGTLLGHETIRQTLLSQLGTHCEHLAQRQAKRSGDARCSSLTLAVTSASAGCASAASGVSAPPPPPTRASYSRVGDARATGECMRDAHFDALQDYWSRHGPVEVPRKVKRGARTVPATPAKQQPSQAQEQQPRSDPCSAAEMVMHVQ